MLTGCYPPRLGFGDFDGNVVLFPGQGIGLNPNEITIADFLRDNAYNTKIIGKWHCGDQPAFLPLAHGFEEYYGLPYSNDMGRQEGYSTQMPPLPLIKDNAVIQQQPDQCSLTERYVEQAQAFITSHRDEPFFLYFAHMHVHLPLYAAEPFVRQSENGDYGACVAETDWAAQVLMHQLDKEGLTDKTIIIFTSDNGSRGDHGGSNYPLRGAKQSTWEGGMRVPCIMRWPGHIPAGRTCRGLFASIDFLPTILALCGIVEDQTTAIDGLDLSRLVLGSEGAIERETFFYYKQNDLEAVRSGSWKLHVRKNGEAVSLLYNLDNDISEELNVYADEPTVVSRLEQALDICRADLGDASKGIKGALTRPAGRVDDPKPLTDYDGNHPYIISMYDKADRG